jgi:pimeloyl-ACP methyl ester carboxylesterase
VGSLVSGVLKLISSGVDPRNITLVGFSRGAQLTLQASSLLRDRGINTVLLAVCSDGDFVTSPPIDRGGRLLSIHEVTDVVGSCARLAARSHLLSFEERAISTGRKHGVFYQPLPEWVDPVVDWIQRQSRMP